MQLETTTPQVVGWILHELRALRAAYDFDIAASVPSDMLATRPEGSTNSIAWLAWHLARCEDVTINAIVRGVPEVVQLDGWADRLGVTDTRIGTGFAPEDVRRIEEAVDVHELDAYASAVRAETVSWLGTGPSLDDVPDVDGRLASMPTIVPPEGEWIRSEWTEKPAGYFLRTVVIAHGYVHLGEMRSVRGRLGIDGL